MKVKTCDVCLKKGVISKLTLKQISFTSAVYLCPNKQCSYPENDQWIIVERSLSEAFPSKKEKALMNQIKKNNFNSIKLIESTTVILPQVPDISENELMQELEQMLKDVTSSQPMVESNDPGPSLPDLGTQHDVKASEFEIDDFLSEFSQHLG